MPVRSKRKGKHAERKACRKRGKQKGRKAERKAGRKEGKQKGCTNTLNKDVAEQQSS